MKTVKHTLRLPVSALNNSGHCSALSAKHCQRNRAPHFESSCCGAQILLFIFYVKAYSIYMQSGLYIIL